MKTRIICLITACIVLLSAITVSAVNGSPYEQLKNAILDALYYDNYTMEAEFKIRENGIVDVGERIFISQRNNTVLLSGSSWYEDKIIQEVESHNPNGDFSEMYVSYRTPHLSLNKWDLRETYVVDIYNPDNLNDYCCYRCHPERAINLELGEMFFYIYAERDSNSMRFAELVTDLFIGDIKNNISMSTQDGIRSFSVEVTGTQIPQIIRLMTDITAENRQMKLTDDSRVKSVTINRFRGDAKIDSSGNLIYLETRINLTATDEHGITHDIDIDLSVSFSGIGTSNPKSPVLGFEELFTLDYIRSNFPIPERGNYRTSFSLDEHGNIDMESIRK